MGRKAATYADELCLRASVRLVDTSALRASSARIARINSNKKHSFESGLVTEKFSQLIERPRMQSAPLSLSNCYPIANAREILDGDTASGVFGFADNLFADHMVRVRMEVPFFATKSDKMALGAFSPNALKFGSELCDSVASAEDAFSRVDFAVRVESEIADAKVNAKPSIGFTSHLLGYFDRDEEEELTFAIDKISLPTFAFEQCLLMFANEAGDNHSSLESEQTHLVETLLERIGPLIEGDASAFAESTQCVPVSFVGIANLSDSSTRVLCRQPKQVANVSIKKPVQFERLGDPDLECALSEPVARCIDLCHGLEKLGLFLFRNDQLDLCGQLHAFIVPQQVVQATKNRTGLLPALKDGVSAPKG
jgi:hypothetical protein